MEESIRFLIAEDEETVQQFLGAVLRDQQYRDIHMSKNGLEAYDMLLDLKPDVLITDLVMPGMRGEELARRALQAQPDLTVLVTTGNGTIKGAVDLLKRGVFDFITKPFNLESLQASIARGVDRCNHQAELSGAWEVIEALMVALESKDRYLRGHSSRVASMTGKLARLAGWQKQDLRILEYAALVHDVGKIAVPELILNKPGALTAEEMEVIKRHPVCSRDILQPIRYLRRALPFVYHHHERFDGRGYPDGLAGMNIPEGARLITICDSFDAMATARSYRQKMPVARIIAILQEEKNKQFDPRLVDLFLSNLDTIQHPDTYEQRNPS